MKRLRLATCIVGAVMVADVVALGGRLALCHVMPSKPPSPDCLNQVATASMIGQKLLILWATLTPGPDPHHHHYHPQLLPHDGGR